MTRALAGAAALAVGVLVHAGAANAAVGDLTFESCVGTLSGCVAPGNSGVWRHPETVAVSPDGTRLYVGARGGSESISHLTLDGSGNPTYSDCVGLASGCLAAANLDGLFRIVLSPDGKQLYASSNAERMGNSDLAASSVIHFPLAANGAFQGDLSGNATGDCVGGPTTCTTGNSIHNPGGMAVSPVGDQLYVTNTGVQLGNVTHLSLSPSMAPIDCVGNFNGCVAPNPADALDGADAIAISPDGKQLYVGGANGISHLTLDGTGTATFQSCIGVLSGCATTPTAPNALSSINSLAISSDGHHLYASTRTDNAISHLTLDASGTPTFHDCSGVGAGCNPVPLAYVSGDLALTPDGTQLYAAPGSAIEHFTVDGAGVPTFAGCFGPASGCTPSGPSGWVSTGGANVALAISRDGKHLYTTFEMDPAGGVGHFTITPSSTGGGGGGTGGGGGGGGSGGAGGTGSGGGKNTSSFALTHPKVAKNGVITFRLNALGPGKFKATATTSLPTAQKAVVANHGHKHQLRKILYGGASATALRAGAITLVIKPSRRARTALANGTRLTVQVSITFTAVGGAQTTHRITVTVHERQRRVGSRASFASAST